MQTVDDLFEVYWPDFQYKSVFDFPINSECGMHCHTVIQAADTLIRYVEFTYGEDNIIIHPPMIRTQTLRICEVICFS